MNDALFQPYFLKRICKEEMNTCIRFYLLSDNSYLEKSPTNKKFYQGNNDDDKKHEDCCQEEQDDQPFWRLEDVLFIPFWMTNLGVAGKNGPSSVH